MSAAYPPLEQRQSGFCLCWHCLAGRWCVDKLDLLVALRAVANVVSCKYGILQVHATLIACDAIVRAQRARAQAIPQVTIRTSCISRLSHGINVHVSVHGGRQRTMRGRTLAETAAGTPASLCCACSGLESLSRRVENAAEPSGRFGAGPRTTAPHHAVEPCCCCSQQQRRRCAALPPPGAHGNGDVAPLP